MLSEASDKRIEDAAASRGSGESNFLLSEWSRPRLLHSPRIQVFSCIKDTFGEAVKLSELSITL